MKILGILLALISLLATAFLALAAANKSHSLAHDLSQLMGQLGGGHELDVLGKKMELPSTGRLNAGALIGAIGGITALVLLVAAFVKKQWVGGLATLTIACAAISAAIYPHIETGPGDGAAPRLLAVIAIGLAVLGSLGAALAARDRR
ncbi:MAG TPA: hypothetical protein VGG74_38195 [Kofleriaceae bacterium]|jgi:hypothetical protein